MAKKQPTVAQKKRMSRIASLGCLICKAPANIHHCGTFLGGGRDDDNIIPLCHVHHQNGGYGVALHAGKKAWEAIHGTEQELMDKTERLLKINFA